ncbi:hypothetical protein [Vreelandella titanicae]|uniref:hypothetical protein n=1 Tax=Vreelandella titanicae TaxID=664683 RepID=UPI003827BAAD
MDYDKTYAYCFSKLKAAAVFHDRVEPTTLLMSEISPDLDTCVRVTASLQGFDIRSRLVRRFSHKIFADRIKEMHKWIQLSEKYRSQDGYPEGIPDYSSVNKEEIPILFRSAAKNAEYKKLPFREHIHNQDIENIYWRLLDDVDAGNPRINVLHGVEYISPFLNTIDNVACILSDIDVVDPELLTWEQIIELRRDKESLNDLRSLRLFMYENFDGKSLAYIEDKLESMLYLHQQKAKSWGFETMMACMDTCVSKENLLCLGLLSATVFGAPLEMAAGAGAVATLGKMTVTLHNRKVKHRHELSQFGVKYLWDIKQLTSQSTMT